MVPNGREGEANHDIITYALAVAKEGLYLQLTSQMDQCDGAGSAIDGSNIRHSGPHSSVVGTWAPHNGHSCEAIQVLH